MPSLTRYLQEEAGALAVAAEHLVSDRVENMLSLLELRGNREAKLVITDVGKSGTGAPTIATTFCSIGLMAVYVNPLDAMHGNLGVVATDNVYTLLSNSSEKSELLELLPHLKRHITAKSLWSNAQNQWPSAAMWCWKPAWIGRSAT